MNIIQVNLDGGSDLLSGNILKDIKVRKKIAKKLDTERCVAVRVLKHTVRPYFFGAVAELPQADVSPLSYKVRVANARRDHTLLGNPTTIQFDIIYWAEIHDGKKRFITRVRRGATVSSNSVVTMDNLVRVSSYDIVYEQTGKRRFLNYVMKEGNEIAH